MGETLDATLSKPRIARHTAVIGVGTFAVRLISYLKIAVLAAFLGTGAENSAYAFAIILPSLFSGIMANAMSPTLLPIFSEYLAKGRRKDAWSFAWSFIAVLGALTIVIYVFLVSIFNARIVTFAEGLSPATRQLSTNIFYIVAPSLLLASTAASLRALMQSLERFLAFNLAQFFGIATGMLSLVLLWPTLGVYAAALALTLSFLVEIICYIPVLMRERAFSGIQISTRAAGFSRIRLFAAYLLGATATQLNATVDRCIASRLPENSISFIYYASTLQMMGNLLLGGAISMAILPLLSRQAAIGKHKEFDDTLTLNIRVLILIFYPYTLCIWFLAPVLLSVFLQRGAFDYSSTTHVANAWRIYALASFTYVFGRPIINAFYARKRAGLLASLTVGSVLLNVVLNLWFAKMFGYLGLAIATSLAMTITFCVIASVYEFKGIGRLKWKSELLPAAMKYLLAAIPGSAVSFAISPYLLRCPSVFFRFAGLCVTIVIASVTYFGVLLAMRETLACELLRFFRGRLARGTRGK